MDWVRDKITPCLTCRHVIGTWNAALLTGVDIGSNEFSCSKHGGSCYEATENPGVCREVDSEVVTSWGFLNKL